MSKATELDSRIVRESINQAQVWNIWLEAERIRRHSYTGTMVFEKRGDNEYLYRRKGKSGKSLGPKSEETEAILEAFRKQRDENKDRLNKLNKNMDTQAAILRALKYGRVPVIAARILRELEVSDRGSNIRIVGTNALYAYEAISGTTFESGITATEDIDLLQDDRVELKLVSEDRRVMGLMGLIQEKVDKSFTKMNKNDFRMQNNDGYIVDLIRPEPKPAFKRTPGSEPVVEDDLTAIPVFGLQWLANAPLVETVAIDERGYPVPMRAPDPRYWASHKVWLSEREDRNGAKKIRDKAQARSVFSLVNDQMPHLSLGDDFISKLPGALKDGARKMIGEIETGGDDGDRLTPNW